MTDMKFSWTTDQEQTLAADGDLMLTASAGTGKTTILVEKFSRRLFELIEEIQDREPAAILGATLSRMAAITFTEMAAAQLKDEIRKKLARRYSERLEDWLPALTRRLEGSYIGTIHSFCSRILRENFLEAGLSPGFGITSDEEAHELQIEAADEALQGLLSDSTGNSFIKELAIQHGFVRLRDEIITLCENLRTDGYYEINPDEIIAKWRGGWTEKATTCAGKLEILLEEMNTFLLVANRGQISGVTPSKTTEEAQVKLQAVIEKLQPVFAYPAKLLEENTVELLLDLSFRKLGKKGYEPFSETLDELREIWQKSGSVYRGRLADVAGIEADVSYIRALLEAYSSFVGIYKEKKFRLDMIDFDDLLLLTCRLLKDNDSIRNRYRRQFRHIFVDEFQDVNPIQVDIVKLLHKPGEGRSLVIVGDGKQSIYRFRGADVLSFENFGKEIIRAGGGERELVSNFRSHPGLIRTFNALFGTLLGQESAETRYQIKPTDMKSFHPGDETKCRVVWIRIKERDARREGMIIARSILRFVNSRVKKRDGSPVGFGDIAVLLATQSDLFKYEEALRNYSIPYIVVKGQGFFRQREIWDVASYLRLLWFPEDDYALAAVLRSPLCLLSDETLFRFAEAGILDGTRLFDEPLPKGIPREEQNRFATLRRLVVRHRGVLDGISTAQIIEELLEATNYEAVLLSRPGGDQSAANLRKLIEKARSFESRGLASGLEFALEISAKIFEKDKEPQALLGGAEDRYVRLLTVHKAKGLQFPAVIVPQLYYAGNRPTGPMLYDRHSGLGVKKPDSEAGKAELSPSWKMVSDSVQEQEDAEHLRLLYVAMTRAQDYVVLIGGEELQSRRYLKPWELRLHSLLPDSQTAEALGIKMLKEEEVGEVEGERLSLVERHPEILQPAEIKGVDVESYDAAKNIYAGIFEQELYIPKSFSLGVSDLIPILLGHAIDEINEKESHEDTQESGIRDGRVATLRASAIDVGTAVHKVLETIDYSHPPTVDEISGMLKNLGVGKEANTAAADIFGWLASGEAENIRNAKRIWKEYPFTFAVQRQQISVSLTGVIDLLVELDGGKHRLLDYKYSEPGELERYGLQLKVYSLALRRLFRATPERSSVVYLKGPEVEDVGVTDGELDSLEGEIVTRVVDHWKSRYLRDPAVT